MSVHPVRASMAAIGRTGWMMARATRGAAVDAVEQDDLALNRLAAAFDRLGWRPIPVLAALGAMIGLALGSAAGRTLHAFYAERVVEPIIAQALARDIVPIIIGVFAAGRVAVETAVRLGAMRLNSELDALTVTGNDPVRYVVTPALAAVVMATPLQIAIVFACAWAGFAVAIHMLVVTSFATLADVTLDADTFRALLLGFGKTLLFNLGALAVGALCGMTEARGIGAIGRESTRAFTAGLLLVIAIAAFTVVMQ